MAKEFDLIDELSSDFGNRMGFPNFKVFVFGKNITSDVITVDINTAGGSVERSPSTASITLFNPNSRYIISHRDMGVISNARSALLKKESAVKKSELLNDKDIWGDLASTPDESLSQSVVDNQEISYKDENGITLDQASLEALAINLLQNNVSEYERILASLGFNNLTPLSAKSLASDIISKYQQIKDPRRVSLDTSQSLAQVISLKSDVVNEKLSILTYIEGDSENPTPKPVFAYPYQHGDCIFHFNDPVRIAFQDPFNPFRWYWKFSGFIDTVTEDQGVNFESKITITCTDVSKIPRYASIAIVGSYDASSQPFKVASVLEPSNQTEANAGLLFFQEAFRGMTILEIMETIFFGSKYGEALINNTTPEALNIIFRENPDRINAYLKRNHDLTEEQVRRALNPDETEVLFGDDSNSAKVKRQAIDYLSKGKLQHLQEMNLPQVTAPRGVKFKPKSNNSGVNFFIYGSPDAVDKAAGAVSLDSFYDWNEIIHHRVRTEDLSSMRNTNDYEISEREKELTPEEIVTTIGRDIENYPVGSGGNVYVVMPAQIESSYISIFGAVNKDLGSVGMQSSFRDRLSYIYDLAERGEFRFYSTPRGDIVFEIAMYDFDPDDFWNKKDISDTKLTDFLSGKSYKDVFQDEYVGYYKDISEVLEDLTIFSESTESFLTKRFQFDYIKEFTIEVQDQLGFSNTITDNGLVTAYRIKPNWAENMDIGGERPYKWSANQELIPILGMRVGEGSPWSVVNTYEGAKIYSQLYLNRLNAEARNIGIKILPRYGLMVNRPIFWKSRNYYATIVSISDSITWNSDVSTTINLNQVRSWSGEYDSSGKPIYKHFGNSDRPFNFAEILKKASSQLAFDITTGVSDGTE